MSLIFNSMKKIILFFITLFSLSTYSEYAVDQETINFDSNGVSIAYTVAGEENATPVLMVMGLMASHRLWGEYLVNGLVDAGYKVILFDNRDTGDSENLDRLGKPNIYWKFALSYMGIGFSAPYTLEDMADDGIRVLDELNIDNAHIVGASMGGMIAQTMASSYPERTKSLVSIMSTSGAKHLPEMSQQNQSNFSGVRDLDLDQVHAYGFYPEAMGRQMTAILQAGDRSDQIKTIAVPTLIQHGIDDTLLPVEHGKHTAELIPGSEIIIYDGMGHNLPDEVVPTVLSDMLSFFEGV
jgi:pimeloyl-ACP methyl ester carboxylesterase|tara:strand:- start:811 stop:1698 length:888 start_codon:yes stop_codon:yes gene_type:complete